jgi:hypothetical protein
MKTFDSKLTLDLLSQMPETFTEQRSFSKFREFAKRGSFPCSVLIFGRFERNTVVGISHGANAGTRN